jgi:hypothetical protein
VQPATLGLLIHPHQLQQASGRDAGWGNRQPGALEQRNAVGRA